MPRTIATAAFLALVASRGALAADLPRAEPAPPSPHAAHDMGYREGEVAIVPPRRWVDPIRVGAILPRGIPMMPMPKRYSVIGYGFTLVNGRPLLIDRDTREIVMLLPDQ